jgi:single-strand DNA-binding protein
MGFSKVILIGNLTRDPEIRSTPSGTQIAQFAIAVNRKWKDVGTGQTKEEVSFIDVEAWSKTAEAIAKFFHKGDPIFIEGRLKQDSWEDKTSGQKRSKLKVVAEGFQFQGVKRSNGDGDVSDTEEAPPARRQEHAPKSQQDDNEDPPF